MKKILLFILGGLFVQFSFATIHQVEVGGSLSVTPYYSPQFISIDQGDTVRWNWVLGTHNVTSTSGPQAFASGDIDSPDSWDFIFNITGTYTYECTLFNHADTQFGSITVLTPSSVENLADGDIEIYPNPAVNTLSIQLNELSSIKNIQLFDSKGTQVNAFVQPSGIMDVSELQNGLYILVVSSTEGIIRKRVLIQK